MLSRGAGGVRVFVLRQYEGGADAGGKAAWNGGACKWDIP